MPKRYTEEFEKEMVRLTLTSSRSQSSICQDLGVSRTTLMRWLSKHRGRDGVTSSVDDDVVAELRRLRRENKFLRQEREPEVSAATS